MDPLRIEFPPSRPPTSKSPLYLHSSYSAWQGQGLKHNPIHSYQPALQRPHTLSKAHILSWMGELYMSTTDQAFS